MTSTPKATRVESDAVEQLKAATRQVELSRDRLNRLDLALVRALEAEEQAEGELADAVATLQLAGIEGKNQGERDASLHLATVREHGAVSGARTASRRVRAARERAQRTYDVARYRHRTWRMVVARETGAGGEDGW